MPFWRAADGTLREVEGSFARYVDSLAPYFDEISLCVPVLSRAARRRHRRSDRPTSRWRRCRHSTARCISIRVCASGPALGCSRWGRQIDLLHCRVPSPAAVFAFAIARLHGPARVPARGRRPARAAADDAVSRAEARAVARVHRVRRTERSVDGRPLAHVRQRRRAGGKACAAGSSGDRDDDHDDQRADIATRADTCTGTARAGADRQPDRSAKRPARASRSGAPARRRGHRRHARHRGPGGRPPGRGRAGRDRRGRAPPAGVDGRITLVGRGSARSTAAAATRATTCSSCRRCRAKASRACCSKR